MIEQANRKGTRRTSSSVGDGDPHLRTNVGVYEEFVSEEFAFSDAYLHVQGWHFGTRPRLRVCHGHVRVPCIMSVTCRPGPGL